MQSDTESIKLKNYNIDLDSDTDTDFNLNLNLDLDLNLTEFDTILSNNFLSDSDWAVSFSASKISSYKIIQIKTAQYNMSFILLILSL